MFIIRKTILYM